MQENGILQFDTESYIAHYTKKETFLEYILPTMSIKIGNLENLNDLHERSLDWLDTETLGHKYDLGSNQLFDRLRKMVRKRLRVLCCAGYRGSRGSGLDNTAFCRPRMWAQYGEESKGVCLVFDKEVLANAIDEYGKLELIEKKKMKYCSFLHDVNNGVSIVSTELNDLLTDGNEASVLKSIDKNYNLKHTYFMKHEDWEGEHEFRFLGWLTSEGKDAEDEDVFINIKDALKAVVLGHDFPLSAYSSVLRELKTPVWQINYSMNRYEARHFPTDKIDTK